LRQERILGTGDFVERVVSESGEPSANDFRGAFRDRRSDW